MKVQFDTELETTNIKIKKNRIAFVVCILSAAFLLIVCGLGMKMIEPARLMRILGMFLSGMILCSILFSLCLCLWMLYSPFSYPYYQHSFDVSGRRMPDMEDCIDRFFMDGNWNDIERHQRIVRVWKERCETMINNQKIGVIKKRRKQQYQKCLDDAHAFQFFMIRLQTRYKQVNYVKTAYKVEVLVDEFSCDYEWLNDREQKLKSIDFACTLKEYYTKNQRKLMTPKLRKQIMERDHYTCQICGKYMPDGVGLHIDHIIPISKGGKSIASNLQVLCSKCNGRKSDTVQ